MSEKHKRILELGKQLSILSDYMNQLSEMSKKYLPKTKEMKEICDAGQKAVKEALEIFKEISELKKE